MYSQSTALARSQMPTQSFPLENKVNVLQQMKHKMFAKHPWETSAPTVPTGWGTRLLMTRGSGPVLSTSNDSNPNNRCKEPEHCPLHTHTFDSTYKVPSTSHTLMHLVLPIVAFTTEQMTRKHRKVKPLTQGHTTNQVALSHVGRPALILSLLHWDPVWG